MYNQLRSLQKKAKDLRAEVRNLRRMSQAQAHSVRETIRDAFIKIRAMLLAGGEQVWQAGRGRRVFGVVLVMVRFLLKGWIRSG